MPTADLLPDAELMVRTFLVGRTAISDLVGTDDNGEVRVYTIIPNPSPSTAFVRLIRVGGTPLARRGVDRPIIQLDAYGGTKAQARTLAATIGRELEALDGVTVAGGTVQGIEPGAGRYIPDPDLTTERGRARERYIVDVTLTTRPDRTP